VTVSEGARWKKASRSGGSSGNCVELADLGAGLAVRDSKSPDAVLVFGPVAGSAFMRFVKRSVG
jgi:hypothetical protein